MTEHCNSVSESAQLKQMGVRSVAMAGPGGNLLPTPDGELQLTDIWNDSCAQQNPAWPDFAAFRTNVINDANAASVDSGVDAVFQEAITTNDTSITAAFRPQINIIGICIKTWWFSIYIWRTV